MEEPVLDITTLNKKQYDEVVEKTKLKCLGHPVLIEENYK